MAMWNKALMEWAIWGETYKEWAISVINYIVIQGKMGWSDTVPRGNNSMTPWNRGHNGKGDEGTISKVYDLTDIMNVKIKGQPWRTFVNFKM